MRSSNLKAIIFVHCALAGSAYPNVLLADEVNRPAENKANCDGLMKKAIQGTPLKEEEQAQLASCNKLGLPFPPLDPNAGGISVERKPFCHLDPVTGMYEEYGDGGRT